MFELIYCINERDRERYIMVNNKIGFLAVVKCLRLYILLNYSSAEVSLAFRIRSNKHNSHTNKFRFLHHKSENMMCMTNIQKQWTFCKISGGIAHCGNIEFQFSMEEKTNWNYQMYGVMLHLFIKMNGWYNKIALFGFFT